MTETRLLAALLLVIALVLGAQQQAHERAHTDMHVQMLGVLQKMLEAQEHLATTQHRHEP